MPQIDWENLLHLNTCQEEVFRSIDLLYPLALVEELKDKRLAITDNGLELRNNEPELYEISSLRLYLQSKWARPHLSHHFILNDFENPRLEKWGFELNERAWLLCTAIRIFTSKKCVTKSMFSYNDRVSPTHHYAPFISDDAHNYMLHGDDTAILKTIEDFEKLKLIYERLNRIGVYKIHDSFSKLVNAVRFHNHSADEYGSLQHVVYTFIGLESLFSDSSKAEIMYKVALRTVHFLHPTDSLARRNAFDLLKNAYDVRSKYLHGSKIDSVKLSKKFQNIKNDPDYSLMFHLPGDLYEILTSVLRKILTEEAQFDFFSGNPTSEAEDDFYNTLTLGKR